MKGEEKVEVKSSGRISADIVFKLRDNRIEDVYVKRLQLYVVLAQPYDEDGNLLDEHVYHGIFPTLADALIDIIATEFELSEYARDLCFNRYKILKIVLTDKNVRVATYPDSYEYEEMLTKNPHTHLKRKLKDLLDFIFEDVADKTDWKEVADELKELKKLIKSVQDPNREKILEMFEKTFEQIATEKGENVLLEIL